MRGSDLEGNKQQEKHKSFDDKLIIGRRRSSGSVVEKYCCSVAIKCSESRYMQFL